MFVHMHQDNADVLIRKPSYNLTLKIGGFPNRVVKSTFDSYSTRISKLFAEWRDSNELTLIQCCLIFLPRITQQI